MTKDDERCSCGRCVCQRAAHPDGRPCDSCVSGEHAPSPAEAVCHWYEVAKDKSKCVPMGSHPRNCGVHLGGLFLPPAVCTRSHVNWQPPEVRKPLGFTDEGSDA